MKNHRMFALHRINLHGGSHTLAVILLQSLECVSQSGGESFVLILSAQLAQAAQLTALTS